MTNHEDNERHFQHWLDKNSWRRDLQRLEQEYGAAPRRTPGLIAGADGAGSAKCDPSGRPFTDEFHFDAMSVIRYLGEALEGKPLVYCTICCAPVRIMLQNNRWLCTVCEELAS